MFIIKNHCLSNSRSLHTFKNARLCIPHIQDSFISYPESIIEQLTNTLDNSGLVTFTITTCKRIDLFEKTINSFINCCTDRHLISKWICIDDNSSPDDRQVMQQLYPFFEFILKTPEDKGHARSMNMLLEEIDTPYVFHMEDDWQYFIPGTYISDCIQVINQDSAYGQCLVNRNYAETPRDADFIVGGIFNECSNGLRYCEHEFVENNDEFRKKYPNGASCAYWPHYSLRPGLTRTSVLRRVGEYSTAPGHFEMDYAYRYASLGYKTVFLEHMCSLHIGRLTSERHDESKENAYTLNDESQFGKNKKVSSGVSCKVVNLKRRPDRLEQFSSSVELQDSPFLWERYEAVDGLNLKSSRRLEQIFNPNDYNYRRCMIGCALSHIDLWVQLINDTSCSEYVILEDDVELSDNFWKKCEDLITTIGHNDKEWGVLFLGHHVYNQYETPSLYDKNAIPDIELWNTTRSLSQSKGGTGGYIINKKGALKLLMFIQSRGMTNGIDTMMQHACDTVRTYYCTPHIVYSECVSRENMETVDSDIQRDYSSLSRSLSLRLKEEHEYFFSIGLPFQYCDNELFFENINNKVERVSILEERNVDTSNISSGLTYLVGEYVTVHVPDVCLSKVSHPILNFRLLDGGKMSVSSVIF